MDQQLQIELSEGFCLDTASILRDLVNSKPTSQAVSRMIMIGLIDLLQTERQQSEILQEKEAAIIPGRLVDDQEKEVDKLNGFVEAIRSNQNADVYLIFRIGATTLIDVFAERKNETITVSAYKRERT